MANDKQKALYCSDKPILETWPSHISIINETNGGGTPMAF
jgi:hypothetical protein